VRMKTVGAFVRYANPWKFLLVASPSAGILATASRPSDWSTGGISNEDGVEMLCDSSFLQTSFHTEQVLNTPGQLPSGVRKLTPEVAMVEPLSLFQVNEEVLSSTDAGMSVANEMISDPGADVLDIARLRLCALLFNTLFAFVILWKGALAFTRLLRKTREVKASKEVADKNDMEETVVPKESFHELQVEDQTPHCVPKLSALEVQQLLPAFSGYDCALSKPKSLGRPFRLRARIYGPAAEVEPIVAPFTEEVCVLCSTKVQLQCESGEATVILERSESVDFLANLEGAPDLQVMVHAKDVKPCLKSQSVRSSFESVPKKLKELVEIEGGLSPETPLQIQEDLLRVGDLVTLVGDLHRDAAGRLMIWPSTPPKREMHRVYELMDGMHVLISDEESFGARKAPHEEQ